jgi:hypothetical protein
MRPALQRLLSRPSSLELLRCLVGTPESLSIYAPAARIRQCQHRVTKLARGYSSTAGAALKEDVYIPKRRHDGPEPTMEVSANYLEPTETVLKKPLLSAGYYGPWKAPTIWAIDEIDFQSDLAAPQHAEQKRLIDQPEHEKDMRLFARLLDHRERRYGMEGIRMFWEAVKNRGIHLPTQDYRRSKGLPAEKLWKSFLKLGFYDNRVLEEICAYADELLEKRRERWPRLYATVVEHFLIRDQGKEALVWHNRLLERHPPSATSFATLCHRTVRHRGDLEALKEIYDTNEHRNAYGSIVPMLCRQEDFRSAKEWHFKLLEKGDIPVKAEHAQALSRFLAIYDRRNAVRVTQSLVDAGAPFEVTNSLKENVKISREMMNLIHGETFNIPVKDYNDEYGARWFATAWVPLDLTMHSVHALGIQEIGPLSLQALCLRNEPGGGEPGPDTILRRIEQLESIGISIGNSVFSRAVKHFAQNRKFNHLMGLLKSDQHPDALEDWKSLEDLLAHFARIRDWDQYRRILAIRTFTSKVPAIEAQNVWLRTHITNEDVPAVLDTLSQMQVNGTIVKTSTIAYILRAMLEPRRRGRKIIPGWRNLYMVSTILKGIMDAGSLVPAAYWREIIRRFGMMRPNNELRDLCIFLASRYGSTNKYMPAIIGTQRAAPHRVPSQVDPSHPLHPLKILFPPTLQKSIIAWGFIHALEKAAETAPTVMTRRNVARLSPKDHINGQVTAGISLLKELRQLGVHIDWKAIKKAIFDRLIVYYGPGRSSRLYNRVAWRYVPEFGTMIRLIDDAMGRRTFDGDLNTLKHRVVSRGRVRLLGRDRKARTRETNRLKSRVLANDR